LSFLDFSQGQDSAGTPHAPVHQILYQIHIRGSMAGATSKRDRVRIGTDSRGNYQRDLGGKTPGGGRFTQHRFYLGRDKAQALLRFARLDQVWAAVEQRWQREGRPTGRPLWDDVTLQIALAVSHKNGRRRDERVRRRANCLDGHALGKRLASSSGSGIIQRRIPLARGGGFRCVTPCS
jgi:hypothetical protein